MYTFFHVSWGNENLWFHVSIHTFSAHTLPCHITSSLASFYKLSLFFFLIFTKQRQSIKIVNYHLCAVDLFFLQRLFFSSCWTCFLQYHMYFYVHLSEISFYVSAFFNDQLFRVWNSSCWHKTRHLFFFRLNCATF